MKTELLEVFNETQIEVLKHAVKYGIWGDTGCSFGNFNQVTASAIGCCTNDIKLGKEFFGKRLSGLISGIEKVIKKNDLTFIASFPDYWGDGGGDTIFFNIEELETGWEDLVEWANN